MTPMPALQTGDRVLVGTTLITVDESFARSLQAGDTVLGIASTGKLRRIPAEVQELVSNSVTNAVNGFKALQTVSTSSVNHFFSVAASRLVDDDLFSSIAKANEQDVADAAKRGRSTTRLVLSPKMRQDMIEAFLMWRDAEMAPTELIDSISHVGWEVQQWKSPLGVIGFVFEGRPNVFADATGVLKGGNTVVFRIGSDALGTATAIMQTVITPALHESGLPESSVVLLPSIEHAAGWALFADQRLSLAVARGSGEAVAELGSIAQQAGVAASLHGTGGAWMIVGESADAQRFTTVLQHSLDRKVCNTTNVVCIPQKRASELVPLALTAAERAASLRNTHARVHAVNGAEAFLPNSELIDVYRSEGVQSEQQITVAQQDSLSHEFEWEENPEFFLVLTADVEHSIELFNAYSPQFVVSAIAEDSSERDQVWSQCNAPFVGDGFTRWVDGQFALLRPELGLSNWQHGRLFARGGVLSGDSAYTVRLRVNQTDPTIHR